MCCTSNKHICTQGDAFDLATADGFFNTEEQSNWPQQMGNNTRLFPRQEIRVQIIQEYLNIIKRQ